MQRYLRYATVAVLPVVMACAMDGVSADRIVLHTPSVVSGGPHAFSVAPDGSFLLFVAAIDETDGPQFVLQDLRTLTQRHVQIDADAVPVRLLVDPGRWSADSRQVFLEDDAGGAVVLDVSAARARRAPANAASDEPIPPDVTFHQLSPTQIEVRLDGRVLATHAVQGAVDTAQSSALAARSLNREWVSYVIQSSAGSFLRDGAGYVVKATGSGGPRRLAGNIISSIRFDEGHTAYALRRAAAGTYEIAEWRLEQR